MKCVCTRRCQIRIQGQPIVVHPGEVRGFKKCPPNWTPITPDKIDFATASEAELKAGNWKVPELLAAAKKLYDVDIEADKDTTRAELVEKFLYARHAKV